jgi:hypothetical protein
MYSADEVQSPFATDCNNFFRALGCQLSDNQPGCIFEVWVEHARRSGLTPSFRAFVYLVRLSGRRFDCLGRDAERGFELLCLMLLDDSDFLAAQRRAIGCIRLFCELAQNFSYRVSGQAFRVFEECAKAR